MTGVYAACFHRRYCILHKIRLTLKMYQMDEMPTEDLDDNEYMTKNLIETVALLCRNNLKYNFELKIQGLLAITTDNQNVIVVQINEALPKKGSAVASHHMAAGGGMIDCNLPPTPLPPQQSRGLGGHMAPVGRGLARASLGRGRFVRRGGAGVAPRMKAQPMAPNQMAARARIRQQLHFSTPQKKPQPSMMRSPGSAPVRASRPQMSPHEHMDEDQGVMVPYESPGTRRTPVRKTQIVRPKVESESDEIFATPKRPIKREPSGNHQSSDVCVLSDEEEYNPPQLKSEIDQSPLRKRHMPVLSCEVDEDEGCTIQGSLDISLEKVIGSRQVAVKSESVPSVEIENVKEELEWSTNIPWQESSQQHCCSQCGSVFQNMRGLRQHVRSTHQGFGETSDSQRNSTMNVMVGNVVSSPASSSTNAMHPNSNSRSDEDIGEII